MTQTVATENHRFSLASGRSSTSLDPSSHLDKQIIADGRMIGFSFIVALITTQSNTALQNTTKHTNQKNLAIARFFVLFSMTDYNSISVDHATIII